MLSGSEIVAFTEKQIHVQSSQLITKSEILSVLESHLNGGSCTTFKKSAKYKTKKKLLFTILQNNAVTETKMDSELTSTLTIHVRYFVDQNKAD